MRKPSVLYGITKLIRRLGRMVQHHGHHNCRPLNPLTCLCGYTEEKVFSSSVRDAETLKTKITDVLTTYHVNQQLPVNYRFKQRERGGGESLLEAVMYCINYKSITVIMLFVCVYFFCLGKAIFRYVGVNCECEWGHVGHTDKSTV